MMPVTNASGQIVGVLSEADVLRDSVPPRTPREPVPTTAGDADKESRLIARLMNQHPVTVLATADLATAAELMSDAAVKSVPVVDEDDMVLGVISRRDLAHVLARTDDAIKRDLVDLLSRMARTGRWRCVAARSPLAGRSPAERAVAELAAMTVLGVRVASVDPD